MFQPAGFKGLKLQPHLSQARLKSVGSKLMNDRSQIGDDEVKGGDVVAGRLRRRGHFVGEFHFQSPVGSDDSTVQTPGEGVTPRAFAGASPC